MATKTARKPGLLADYLTVTGAAIELGLHRDTLEKAMATGKLRPETTRDGLRLLSVAELSRWRESTKLGRPRKGEG